MDSIRPDSDEFRRILLNDIPLLDVRAPVEYNEGSFPAAVNKPLLDDEQRRLIGTEYKQQGQDAAIVLGNKLATRDVHQQRIDSWLPIVDANPAGYLYCFRGGLRSRISQQWLKEAGRNYPFIKGGYKAMRRFLIDEQQRVAEQSPMLRINGLTGTAKTRMIEQLANGVDLEGIANHRGSAFGRRPAGQPEQINFENNLSIDFLKREAAGATSFILEDEGVMVGRCNVPLPLRSTMDIGPVAVVDMGFDERIENLRQDYIYDSISEYEDFYGAELGLAEFGKSLLASLERIVKRLGHERYGKMKVLLEQAVAAGDIGRTDELLTAVMAGLMQEYYDPMYEYQLQKKLDKMVFRGSWQEVKEYAESWQG
ncbi:tRNA 2-selenouridine synthase [Sinobacterium norvegicum]|uniref:tRNA 2-selenouridine synthase n=1 Tax=Sinobacterium norvegicum TaxID=1641715 RepID=A0ABM9AIB4_9GAMM|nr:tRNA 2-selenouridine(34) synthase MnmH [Sinobacterium norvegicum]CAH0992968.1 tRNA 2-selenouridine synthase [Sinobacterium norvegicum]